MAIYDRQNGYKVRIEKALCQTQITGMFVVEEWFVVCVFDDPRLSHKLNGQRVGHPTRMEKALNLLRADNGKQEIIDECKKKQS